MDWLQILQLASTLSAVGGMLFVGFQVWCQNKQLKFDCLTRLHHELLTPSIQEALRFIHWRSPQELVTPGTAHELQQIEHVLNTFDLIGFRMKCSTIPKKATLETEWATILQLWPKVRCFVEEQRRRRENPRYKAHLEWLVGEAERYRASHHYTIAAHSFVWEFNQSLSTTMGGAQAQDVATTVVNNRLPFDPPPNPPVQRTSGEVAPSECERVRSPAGR